MTAKKELGEKIKAARAGKGWKQKHLAAEVDVEPITVSRWERGATTPDLDVLRLVAEATGRPLSFFVDSEPAPPPAAPDVTERVDRLEQSISRLEAKLDALVDRLSQ